MRAQGKPMGYKQERARENSSRKRWSEEQVPVRERNRGVRQAGGEAGRKVC